MIILKNDKEYKKTTVSTGKSKDYDIKREIEATREKLYGLINILDNVSDKEIIEESQRLDELLNNYERLKLKI